MCARVDLVEDGRPTLIRLLEAILKRRAGAEDDGR